MNDAITLKLYKQYNCAKKKKKNIYNNNKYNNYNDDEDGNLSYAGGGAEEEEEEIEEDMKTGDEQNMAGYTATSCRRVSRGGIAIVRN